MELITGYIVFGVVVLIAVGFYFYALPALKNIGIANFSGLINIAFELVRAVEQEFKFQAPDPSDPDYEAKVAEFNAQKKAACLQAVKDVLVQYKLPVPSDEIISKAIEVGVFLMNEAKKLV